MFGVTPLEVVAVPACTSRLGQARDPRRVACPVYTRYFQKAMHVLRAYDLP